MTTTEEEDFFNRDIKYPDCNYDEGLSNTFIT